MLIIKRLGIVVCITIIFGISVFISTVSANPDTFGGEVTTVPGGIVPTVNPPEGGMEDEVAGNQSHFPEDPETYLPMPIPQRNDLEEVESYIPEGSIVSYNLLTGEETISNTDINGLPLDHMEVYGKGDLEGGRDPLNFSGLSLVSNPEDWPYRPNVKIFVSQGGGNYVCSGSLIDPLHVITAGHCVHEGSGGSWSTNVVVVPAYDNGDRPYGDASGVSLHSWSGWTSSGDWDDDIGIIDLNRTVGGLTGWYGYGYHNDCGHFTSGTWRHSGYPASSPYNGLRMYTQTGDFDGCESTSGSWYGNEVWFDRLSYGGQSGSGAQRDNSVYAVLSNGNSTTTWDVRITDTKFGHIGTIIADDTPSTFDLIPLNVKVSPSTIAAGNQLSSMSYVVHNYSSASWSGTVNVSVYISTNDNISTSDTLIDSHNFSSSFGSKDSVTVDVTPPPTIPADKSGNYFIGVILDISDYNTSNNHSNGQDVSAITVQPSNYTLSVSKTGTGSGTVTSSPSGINCGSDCSESYAYNKTVTLTTTPATGSTFTGWSGACSGTGSCVVTMTNDQSVTASFTAGTNNPPYTPSNPAPADNATNVSINTDLNWTGGDPDIGDTVTYDVYFEANDSTPDQLLCNDVSITTCDPGTINYGAHYYWYVIAGDNHSATTTGPIWDFTTEPAQTDYQLFVPIIFR